MKIPIIESDVFKRQQQTSKPPSPPKTSLWKNQDSPRWTYSISKQSLQPTSSFHPLSISTRNIIPMTKYSSHHARLARNQQKHEVLAISLGNDSVGLVWKGKGGKKPTSCPNTADSPYRTKPCIYRGRMRGAVAISPG